MSAVREWKLLALRVKAKQQAILARLIDEQVECPHSACDCLNANCVESKSGFDEPLPPFRVCANCGYAEEGWYCGYKFLAHDGQEIPTMSREGAQSFVAVQVLCKETVAEIERGNRDSLRKILKKAYGVES